MLRRLFALVLCAFVLPVAVGCDNDPDPDGGLPDGSVPDAATPDAGPDTRITVCPGDALPALSTGVCEATPGDANTLITGDVLLPGEVLRGGQVLVGADGRITCAACDCGDQPGAASATAVVCPDGVVSPGLINGHEHLRFVAGPPTMTAERYQHRQEWREGLGPHTEIRSGGTSSTAMVLYEELRMAMAGVTSGNTNGGRDGLVRNLDEGDTEGLGAPPHQLLDLPLRRDRRRPADGRGLQLPRAASQLGRHPQRRLCAAHGRRHRAGRPQRVPLRARG